MQLPYFRITMHAGHDRCNITDAITITITRSPSDGKVLGMQIIQVNLTSENPQPLKSGSALDFTFSVEWEATPIPFARRFERYLDYSFFEHQVR